LEGSQVGDNELYRGCIQLEKEGTTLTFRNEGTAENKNAMNLSYAGFRTAISCAVNPLMMYDNMWVASGAYRPIDIETEPGTMNRAQWPSGVSSGGTMSVHLSIGLIQEVIAKMLSASEYRDDIILGPYAGICPISQSGIDQWGNPFGTMNLDLLGSGIGARANRDGIDVGGQMHDPLGPLPNMENNEESFPILYLYRGESVDSGGPGEYRGGAAMSYCWKPHKTEQIENVFSGTGAVAPIDQSIGGYPGAGIANRIVEDSNVDAHFEERTIPRSLNDLDGTLKQLAPKSEETQLPADVIEARAGGSPGYGDPTERPPEKVARDVDDGLVSESAAYDIYGVVLDTDGDDVTVREEATADRRNEIREERLSGGSILAEGGDDE
jgi:N-methylhydantoinase B